MDASSARERIPKKTFGQRLWKLFSSPKLAMVLMIILAAVSVVGTVLPQGREADFYLKEFGPDRAWWILTLGLSNMYYTWWFLSILMLLNVNIFVCFYGRFPKKYKAFSKTVVDVGRAYIIKQRSKAAFTTSAEPEAVASSTAELLGRYRFRVKSEAGKGSLTLLGTKGLFGRFGSDITHIAFLIIIGGAIFGNLFGFKDFIAIFEGDTRYVERGGFSLRLDDFNVEYYPNSSRPKDYKSTLTVIEEGQEKLTKVIEVNDPLIYKNIWFYQSSYGEAWRKIEEATLQVYNRETGEVLGQYRFPFGQEFSLPKDRLKLKMVDFVADFTFDTASRQVYSKSAKHRNPAVLAEVYENGKLTSRPWIFLNFPDAHFFQSRGSKYLLRLVSYKAIEYSGLQVTKDPGVNIVWFGCFLLTLGMLLTFFVFHKRIWVRLEAGEPGTEVVIGGSTNKNVVAFEKEFHSLVRELKASLDVSEERGGGGRS